MGQLDQRRRASESKLNQCIATVKASNLEIDQLKALKKAKP